MLRKRVLAICLAALLAFTPVLQPFVVYAESTGTAPTSEVAGSSSISSSEQMGSLPDEIVSTEDAPDSLVADSSEQEAIDQTDQDTSSALDDAGEMDEVSAPQPEEMDISSVAYVYVDQSVLAIGDTQYIVIGFNGLCDSLSAAQISLRSTQHELITVNSSKVIDDAALFEIEFSEDGQADVYSISDVTLTLQNVDTSYVINFSDDANENNDYSFEVVTADVANALNESGTEGGVTAMTIGENGELKSAASVDDAIEIADASGVQESKDNATAPSVSGARSRSTVSTTREDYLIVAIDPGHGGGDVGAVGNGLQEATVNWGISQNLKNELDSYTGVTAYLIRSENEEVSLQARADRAKAIGADVFISVHCNSATASANGAEVWAPNSSSYNSDAHTIGTDLGNKILAQLSSLGLYNRGVKFKDYPADGGDPVYPDGSRTDYYGVIRNCRKYGIPAIIVEHAFISNSSDANYLANRQRDLGVADATGIAQQYNLGKDAVARAQASVEVQAHVSDLGWEDIVYDHKVAGTTGKSKNLEAFKLNLLNNAASSGGVEYRSYVNGSWQDWVKDGAESGTTGKSTAIQAVQIQLTGDAEQNYDIYYRVHSAEVGWLGWAKNGGSAGTIGYGYDAQAIEVVVVAKGADAPGSTSDAFRDKATAEPVVTYRAHVQEVGWQGAVNSGAIAGTTAQGRCMEALVLNLDLGKYANTDSDVSIEAHCQDYGWRGAVASGAIAGTTGEKKELEAVKISLSGSVADFYDIYYRVHVSEIGWMNWAKNGEPAGTEGYSLGIEAIQIVLQKKGEDTLPANPGIATTDVFRKKPTNVVYRAHVAELGWQNNVSGGATAGTTGRGLSVEALNVSLSNQDADEPGAIQTRVFYTSDGWQDWTTGQAGSTGQSKQIEAIQIRLTDDMADNYDVYYRVHSAEVGWLDWAKNGESAGSEGLGYGIQAIQIDLVKKEEDGTTKAPGKTDEPFISASISYRVHVAEIGWQSFVGDGAMAGTTGQSHSVQAIEAYVPSIDGTVKISAHIQDLGWVDPVDVSQGVYAGTVGQGRQIEALCIELEGDVADEYDVYYRVHSSEIGWLDWAKNGERAGTQGFGFGIEAVQIKLVKKGSDAPGSTETAFRTPSDIMGHSLASVSQMVSYFQSSGYDYPASVYSDKGAPTLTEFCNLVENAANAEGVRADVLFCQAMKETGWLQFGGAVKPEQCNFGGLGSTGDGVSGASFGDVYTGLLAQAQHLKAYASTAPLNATCVDPRFDLIERGIAPKLEDLDGRWAVPGVGYGESILVMINEMISQ